MQRLDLCGLSSNPRRTSNGDGASDCNSSADAYGFPSSARRTGHTQLSIRTTLYNEFY